MGYLESILAAPTQKNNDADYLFPDTQGQMLIHKMFKIDGLHGTVVVLEGEIVSATAKVAGGKVQAPGTKVKKLYMLTKFPTVAPGQLKTDVLKIVGLNESDVTAKDIGKVLSSIFEDEGSPNYALTGVLCNFNTKTVDRSAKGKAPITAVYFNNVGESAGNSDDEVAARKAAL